MSPAHPKLEVVLDLTVKDRAPPPTSWSMQDYTNPQSCFRTFCYFSAHALPTLLFPIFFSQMFFALVCKVFSLHACVNKWSWETTYNILSSDVLCLF